MNDAFNYNVNEKERDQKEYTTRIIRMYGHDDGGQIVYDRLDWELRKASPVWKEHQLEQLRAKLDGVLQNRKPAAVLIKDMRKGAINRKIIEKLVAWYGPSVRWYVSSKTWLPEWLECFKKADVDLKLLLMPQVAAREALQTPGISLSRWLTTRGELSHEALGKIDELVSKSGASHVVVLPDGFSVIAHAERDDRYLVQSLAQPESQRLTASIDMGMASIAFPAMVAYMEHTGKFGEEAFKLRDLVCWALRVTREWVHEESRRVTAPSRWSSKPTEWSNNRQFERMRKVLQQGSKFPSAEFGKVQELWANQEKKKWIQAFDHRGVIEVTPAGPSNSPNGEENKDSKSSTVKPMPHGVGKQTRREIQLWRSMVEIPGYVCIEEQKRSELRRLTLGIRSFLENPKHHASCVIVASPGSGKSYLVKRLAAISGLRLVPFNITQLRSKADLVDCFDTIGAIQRDQHRPLLVFVDEINAPLEGGPPYGSFLTTLEDGSYVRAGKTLSLDPCIWIFAGTTTPGGKKMDDSLRLHQPDKGSDFFSRLTLGIIDLKRDVPSEVNYSGSALEVQDGDDKAKRSHHMRALENVYIGTTQLKTEFREVRYVSEQVLEALYALPITIGVRDIKYFVRCFHEIQYGCVTSQNVPKDLWPGGAMAPGRAEWEKALERLKRQHLRERADIEIVE